MMASQIVEDDAPNTLRLVCKHKLVMYEKADSDQKQRGDSFQVDDLVDSIRHAHHDHRPANIANAGQQNHNNPGAGHSTGHKLPNVSLVQGKPQEPKRMRSGFFKRFFSSSSNNLAAVANQDDGNTNARVPSTSKFFKNGRLSSHSTAALGKEKDECDKLSKSSEAVPLDLQTSPGPSSDTMYDTASQNIDLEAPLPRQPFAYELSALPVSGSMTRTRSASLVKDERDLHAWSRTRHKSHTSEHSDGQSGDWSHVYPSYLHDPTSINQSPEKGTNDRTVNQATLQSTSVTLPKSPKANHGSLNLSDRPISQSSISRKSSEVGHGPSESDDATTLLVVKASAMYESQDQSMSPEKYAAYLGTEDNGAVRHIFLELFDFSEMSVLQALRRLCSKLYIKGETQVIDRILESFSQRWWDCNQANKFLTKDIVHIIAYALITLNTDLYVANTQADQKMRRSAFVQNTMQAIDVMHTMPHIEHRISRVHSVGSTEQEPSLLGEVSTIRFVPKSASSNTILQDNSTKDAGHQNDIEYYSPSADSDAVLATLNHSHGREEYLKTQLQEMYLSVRNEQIRQPRLRLGTRHNTSETGYSARSAQAGSPSIPSSTRSRSFVMYGDASANTSVTSVDLPGDYHISPAAGTNDSTPGKPAHGVFGPHSGSRLSISSRASRSALGTSTVIAPSRGIGFAGSLSNAIIREETTSMPLNDTEEMVQAVNDAVEDDLMLSGAPFAKEGRLHYKMQTIGFNRRSRYKQWSSELFAVLERGQLRLFDFNAKVSKINRGTFGGGDWTQSAKMVQDISLIQCVAYRQAQKTQASDRAHMWTLKMPNGDLHYFQVGTEELIEEWTSTANYWAARVTKEPLLGAVDNAEYGWSEAVLQSVGHRRASIAPSVANNVTGDDGTSARLGSKANIRDWQPDPSPTLTSSLSQQAQLASFTKFLRGIEAELERHRALRTSMVSAYPARHPNLHKAVANHDRKTAHLQDTVTKYEVYIEALKTGISLSETIEESKGSENLEELTSAK